MHIAVQGTVEHLYHIQLDLSQGGVNIAWMLPVFYRKIVDWQAPSVQMSSRPTHMAKIVRQEPTQLVLCDASGLRVGGGCWDGTFHLLLDIIYTYLTGIVPVIKYIKALNPNPLIDS